MVYSVLIDKHRVCSGVLKQFYSAISHDFATVQCDYIQMPILAMHIHD